MADSDAAVNILRLKSESELGEQEHLDLRISLSQQNTFDSGEATPPTMPVPEQPPISSVVDNEQHGGVKEVNLSELMESARKCVNVDESSSEQSKLKAKRKGIIDSDEECDSDSLNIDYNNELPRVAGKTPKKSRRNDDSQSLDKAPTNRFDTKIKLRKPNPKKLKVKSIALLKSIFAEEEVFSSQTDDIESYNKESNEPLAENLQVTSKAKKRESEKKKSEKRVFDHESDLDAAASSKVKKPKAEKSDGTSRNAERAVMSTVLSMSYREEKTMQKKIRNPFSSPTMETVKNALVKSLRKASNERNSTNNSLSNKDLAADENKSLGNLPERQSKGKSKIKRDNLEKLELLGKDLNDGYLEVVDDSDDVPSSDEEASSSDRSAKTSRGEKGNKPSYLEEKTMQKKIRNPFSSPTMETVKNALVKSQRKASNERKSKNNSLSNKDPAADENKSLDYLPERQSKGKSKIKRDNLEKLELLGKDLNDGWEVVDMTDYGPSSDEASSSDRSAKTSKGEKGNKPSYLTTPQNVVQIRSFNEIINGLSLSECKALYRTYQVTRKLLVECEDVNDTFVRQKANKWYNNNQRVCPLCYFTNANAAMMRYHLVSYHQIECDSRATFIALWTKVFKTKCAGLRRVNQASYLPFFKNVRTGEADEVIDLTVNEDFHDRMAMYHATINCDLGSNDDVVQTGLVGKMNQEGSKAFLTKRNALNLPPPDITKLRNSQLTMLLHSGSNLRNVTSLATRIRELEEKHASRQTSKNFRERKQSTTKRAVLK